MDILQKTLLLFILAVLCHGADYRAILRNHQNPDGLWRDDHGIDVQGTLFALTVLGSSSAYEDQAAAQRTRTAIYLNCQEDGSLLGALPFALASQTDALSQLSCFHDNEGWIQEPGAAPDWASTLIMLLLAPTNEFTEQDCGFLQRNSTNDNIRGSLLRLYSLLRHHLQPPEDLLDKLDSDVVAHGFFEQALTLFALATLSRWDEALKLREHLLASQLPEGGWGEANGLPFDLVTTSLAILALDCFHVHDNTSAPDLALFESATSLEDNDGSTLLTTLVSNLSSVPAGAFQLTASALTPAERLPLTRTTISYLAPGKSQRVSLQLAIPDDCTAILLEADPSGATGDNHRDNNSLLVPLSEKLPGSHLGEMLFDWRKPDYPYYLNPGFGAIASISILFPTFPTSLEWKWLCDGSIFSTSAMENPGTHQPILLTADCFPPEGKHTITIQVTQTVGATSHILEASLDIQVLYDACALFCRHAQEKNDASDTVFTAREEILFEAFSSNPAASASVSLFDSSGAYIGNAAAETTAGRFRWNTEALPPGHYKAIAQFWDYDSMDMPSEAECLFDIAPSSTSSNLVIHSVTTPNTGFRFYKGLSCSPSVSLGWETMANISTTCVFSWEISDETDAVVIQSPTPLEIDANLSSLRQWQLLELPDILFDKATTYSLNIQMVTRDQTLYASHPITVTKPPGLIVENKLYHPEGTMNETGALQLPPPDGTTTFVTDRFRLSIQDESFDIPYDFQCDASPLRLADTPENAITITLDKISNALGNPIDGGWLVCQTPYGFLSGENDLTPDWLYGGTIAIPIHNGTASFTFTPQGETPNGLSLLVPIEIFPSPIDSSFISSRIGIVEVFLTNPL